MKNVKILIMAQFEPEFELFKKVYFSENTTEVRDIKGLENPLYIREDGIIGTYGNMGKANSAMSMTLVLSQPDLDFEKALIFSVGCAGGPFRRVSLGDVIIANAVVDFELGHHFSPKDINLDLETEEVFLRFPDFDDFAIWQLNPKLVNWALDTTEDLELEDPIDLPEKIAKIQTGISVTGDDFWHGEHMSKRADVVVNTAKHLFSHRKQNVQGFYKSTQCEDNAIATVLNRFNLLNHLLCIRDISNYDSPTKEISAYVSSKSDSQAFEIGTRNNFKVVDKLVKSISTLHEF
ncbi:MAG: purine nucleoside permease [Candidatus Ancillula sp.]|jgi:purine nucleoside permease|nr:purine nucleoside permease [Candidatus Ancillula sp.]